MRCVILVAKPFYLAKVSASVMMLGWVDAVPFLRALGVLSRESILDGFPKGRVPLVHMKCSPVVGISFFGFGATFNLG